RRFPSRLYFSDLIEISLQNRAKQRKRQSKSPFFLHFHFELNLEIIPRDCRDKIRLSPIFQSRIPPYQSKTNLRVPNKKATKQRFYKLKFRRKNAWNYVPNFLYKNSNRSQNVYWFDFP